MKKFCKSIREDVMNIILKRQKMKLLTKEQQESYENAKISYICKKKLKINIWKIKNIAKLVIIAIIQENIEVLHIAYVIQNIVFLKKFLLVFHNWSNYDCNFIIKELTE